MAKNFRKNNFGYSDTLFIGTWSSGSTFRSLLKFDLETLPKSSVVCAASLNMFIGRNDLITDHKIIDIHRLTERFQEKEVTWKDQPEFCPHIVSSTQITSEIGQFAHWDILELVRHWHLGKEKNKGILLKARDESRASLLAFNSKESADTDRRPMLCITLQEQTQAVLVQGRSFYSNVQRSLLSTNTCQYSLVYDVSTVNKHSFFVQNKGAYPVSVAAQISPDNLDPDWLNDSAVSIVNPSENFAVTTTHLANWVRLAFTSVNPGEQSLLDIWFQSAT